MSFAEPFIEAVPQILILICICFLDIKVLKPNGPDIFSLPPFFWVTFSTSVLSASLGISKFLKIGPCRLVSNQGVLGGFGNVGFLVLMINVASTLLLKGFLLVVIGKGINPGSRGVFQNFSKIEDILSWIGFCYLPSMLYVCSMHIYLHLCTFLKILLIVLGHFGFFDICWFQENGLSHFSLSSSGFDSSFLNLDFRTATREKMWYLFWWRV